MVMQCELHGRELPDEYKEELVKRPELLHAFYFLSERRGGDYSRITDEAIMSYVCYYGSKGIHPDDFLGLMQRLDGHYINTKAEKAKADAEAAKQRAKLGGKHAR